MSNSLKKFWLLTAIFTSAWCSQAQVIQQLIIQNNQTTKDWIIRRELLFSEGDTINSEFNKLIERSIENLYNTRLFNEIQITDTLIDFRRTIIIRVTERWYWWPYIIFEHADRNLATFIHQQEWDRINYGFILTKHNFRGRRETLNLKFRAGYRQQLAINYIRPMLGPSNQKLGLIFDASVFRQKSFPYDIENQQYLYFNGTNFQYFEQRLTGGIQYRPKYNTRHLFSLQANRFQLTDTSPTTRHSLYGTVQQSNVWTTLSYQFLHSTLNYVYYPTRGYAVESKFSSALDQYLNGWTNLYFSLQGHVPIESWFTYSSHLVTDYFNKPTPVGLRSNIGTSYYFRGFEDNLWKGKGAAIVRQQFLSRLVNKKRYVIEKISSEKFNKPFLSIYQTIFTDAGGVFDILPEKNNRWMAAFGIGLDIVSYYDLIFRFEAVYNSEKKMLFNIHLGTVFF